MRFDLVTIFPGYFASPLGEALVGKAIEDGRYADFMAETQEGWARGEAMNRQ